MATYPDDATLDVSVFSVISSSVITTSDASATTYSLPSQANSTAEIVVAIDGVTQATTTYTLATGGLSINFITAPGAGVELSIKVVSIPSRFLVNRSINDAISINYSNTSTTTSDGNTFLINGETESFVLPPDANVTTTSELLVYIGGLYQTPSSYTYPSIVYGNQGIDIGDNTATKLLLNFDGTNGATTTTDASPSAHTISLLNGASLDATAGDNAFGTASLSLDGTNDYAAIPSSSDFDEIRGKSWGVYSSGNCI